MKNYYLLFLLLLFVSCKTSEIQQENFSSSLHKKSLNITDNDIDTNINRLDLIVEKDPSSPISIKSQILISYLYFKKKEYIKSVEQIEKTLFFLKNDELITYMIYLRSMAYFRMIPHFKKSQEYSDLSLSSFSELLNRDLSSVYLSDSKLKIELIKDQLLLNELYNAVSSIKHHDFLTSIKIITRILEKYKYNSQIDRVYLLLDDLFYKIGIHNKWFLEIRDLDIKDVSIEQNINNYDIL